MDWLVNLGYIGLFLGALLAGTVLPLSSDVLLLGVLTAGGNVWISLVAATLGNWLGGMTSYGLGWLGKWEWLERWFNVKKEKLLKQKTFICKYGVWIALFSWFPLIGTVSVIGLGFYKINPKLTTILLLIGCFIRFMVWIVLYELYADRFIEWIINKTPAVI